MASGVNSYVSCISSSQKTFGFCVVVNIFNLSEISGCFIESLRTQIFGTLFPGVDNLYNFQLVNTRWTIFEGLGSRHDHLVGVSFLIQIIDRVIIKIFQRGLLNKLIWRQCPSSNITTESADGNRLILVIKNYLFEFNLRMKFFIDFCQHWDFLNELKSVWIE